MGSAPGIIALGLAIGAVYGGVWAHQFVNFDDPMFLSENTHVIAGLTTGSIRWAWTNKDALLWQPLAWMGHMTVSQFAGMQPAPHLLANLGLHWLNAALLYALLRSLTGAAGRSFAVALLFAVHPANVDTVAWASQLKTTLSTACFLASLLAYTASARRGERFNGGVLLAFALSLLAKPMVLLFPVLLALLDFWPLRQVPPLDRRGWIRWLGPKIPFVVVAVAVVAVTVVPWAATTAVDMDTVHAPEWRRLAAVPGNYLTYLRLCVWPVDLAVLYPEQLDQPPLRVAGATLLLAGISAAAWLTRRRFPALLVGWGWFVVTLLPASGLVRPGQHAVADHYFYVPGIGLFLAAVWLVADLPAVAWRPLRPGLLGAVALVAGWVAHAQVKYWQNSVTLWEHAAAVTPPSPAGQVNLGNALLGAGRDREAERAFNAALGLAGNDFRPYVNLAVIAQRRGDNAGAISLLRQALRLAPAEARILSNLGSLLQDAGQVPEARQLLERAVALRPELAEAQINLGVLLAQTGDLPRALVCFQAAVRLRPDDPVAQQNLQLVLRQLAARPARP